MLLKKNLRRVNDKKDVLSIELSIHEIARELSVGNGQEFKKCSCKINCTNNRCECFKDNLKCNSACHSGRSCQNC